jgi:steroid delta-isomerase-like uncharacterized protein
MPDMLTSDLRTRREAVVRAHAEAENRHDVEATIRTFHKPRYEVVPMGDPIDGPAAVRELLGALLAGFPDFHAEISTLHHSETIVAAEIRMTGSHRGPWAGILPTGKTIDVPLLSLFVFDAERLVCEKVYFDMATLLRQLGALPGTWSGVSVPPATSSSPPCSGSASPI